VEGGRNIAEGVISSRLLWGPSKLSLGILIAWELSLREKDYALVATN